MGRREAVSAMDFVKVFKPMAEAGKSALDIGQALGLTGDDAKVSAYVSVKASQLRKQFKEAALVKAKGLKLKEKATKELVDKMTGMLPRIQSAGKRGRKATVINDILAMLEKMDHERVADTPDAE